MSYDSKCYPSKLHVLSSLCVTPSFQTLVAVCSVIYFNVSYQITQEIFANCINLLNKLKVTIISLKVTTINIIGKYCLKVTIISKYLLLLASTTMRLLFLARAGTNVQISVHYLTIHSLKSLFEYSYSLYQAIF